MPQNQTFNSNFAYPVQAIFDINGIRMPTPTNYTWKPPTQLGINGAGRQRLYPFWSIELEWDYMSIDEYNFLYVNFLGSISGTTTVFLPPIYMGAGGSILPLTGLSGRVYQYINVIVDAPIMSQTIENTAHTSVKMMIRKISPIPGMVQGALP